MPALAAAKQYQIPITDDCIFYGDFWIQAEKTLGERIATGKIKKPDAVVCASDMMAISLCDALQQHGISVPDSIRVTGYDGHIYALTHAPSITTIGEINLRLGQAAVQALHRQMTGQTAEDSPVLPSLMLGASCGCRQSKNDTVLAAEHIKQYISQNMQDQMMRECYMNSSFIAKMAECASLRELVVQVDSLAHIIANYQWLDICICEDWAGAVDKPEQYRTEGYAPKMLLALSKRYRYHERDDYTFRTSRLLPALNRAHVPAFLLITPLHSNQQVYGYCAISYPNADCFYMNPLFVCWCDAISNGLRTLQKRLYTDYLRAQVEELAIRDLMTGLYNRNGLLIYMKQPDTTAPYVLLLLTYNRIITTGCGKPDTTRNTAVSLGVLIANMLQLLCQPQDTAARINEKTYALLLRLPENETPDDFANRILLKAENLLNQLQNAAACPFVPELIAEHALLSGDADAFLSAQLCRLQQKAEQTLQIKSDYAAQLETLRRSLYLHPERVWCVNEVAKSLKLSTGYFHRIYKTKFGACFVDDLICARINKAKHLLKETNLHVQEIADQCGYQNVSHFMRQYKKCVGTTAAEYRRTTG